MQMLTDITLRFSGFKSFQSVSYPKNESMFRGRLANRG